MSKDRIIKKLRTYFSGRKTSEGKKYYDVWFDSFQDADVQLSKEEEESIGNALGKKLMSDIQNDNQKSLGHSDRFNWKFYAAAASILLVVCTGLISFYLNDKDVVVGNTQPIALRSLETPAGKRLMITLADGTKISMNSGSKLFYPETFTRAKREVTLEGEAFFEVAKDAKKPFIVHTGALAIKVWGTSFNINAYLDRPDIQVSVLTGKVSVSNAKEKKEVYLIPNEIAFFHKKDKGLYKRYEENMQSEVAWLKGVLMFDNLSLNEVVKVLYRRYGVSVVLQCRQAGERRITTSFKDESLERVIQVITKEFGLTYTKINNQFLIEDKGCKK